MSNIYTEKKIDSYSQTDISTQTDNKKKGRPVIYTEEEKLQLRKERNRIYQKNRYNNDPEFRQKKIERSAINNPKQYQKLKEKMQRLKELESIFNNI